MLTSLKGKQEWAKGKAREVVEHGADLDIARQQCSLDPEKRMVLESAVDALQKQCAAEGTAATAEDETDAAAAPVIATEGEVVQEVTGEMPAAAFASLESRIRNACRNALIASQNALLGCEVRPAFLMAAEVRAGLGGGTVDLAVLREPGRMSALCEALCHVAAIHFCAEARNMLTDMLGGRVAVEPLHADEAASLYTERVVQVTKESDEDRRVQKPTVETQTVRMLKQACDVAHVLLELAEGRPVMMALADTSTLLMLSSLLRDIGGDGLAARACRTQKAVHDMWQANGLRSPVSPEDVPSFMEGDSKHIEQAKKRVEAMYHVTCTPGTDCKQWELPACPALHGCDSSHIPISADFLAHATPNAVCTFLAEHAIVPTAPHGTRLLAEAAVGSVLKELRNLSKRAGRSTSLTHDEKSVFATCVEHAMALLQGCEPPPRNPVHPRPTEWWELVEDEGEGEGEGEGGGDGDAELYVDFFFTYPDLEETIVIRSKGRLPRPRDGDDMPSFAGDERSATRWDRARKRAREDAQSKHDRLLHELCQRDARREWNESVSTLKGMLATANRDLLDTQQEGETKRRATLSVLIGVGEVLEKAELDDRTRPCLPSGARSYYNSRVFNEGRADPRKEIAVCDDMIKSKASICDGKKVVDVMRRLADRIGLAPIPQETKKVLKDGKRSSESYTYMVTKDAKKATSLVKEVAAAIRAFTIGSNQEQAVWLTGKPTPASRRKSY